jgi:hypothetical protein
VDENGGLFLLWGDFQELTLWLVGIIKPQAGLSVEPQTNVVTTPIPQSTHGETGREAVKIMTPPEPHLPPPERPVLLGGTQEVSADAGTFISEFAAQTTRWIDFPLRSIAKPNTGR